MNKYFTSDLHLNHCNIIKYSNRSFSSVERMNEVLINNINQRAKKEDVLYHLGDFICYGNEKGTLGTKIKPEKFLNKINCDVILIQGNHDKNNRVKYHLSGAYTTLPIIGKVSMSHYPSNDLHCPIYFNKNELNYHLCGHVHNAWEYYFDKDNNCLNINVGIDVWKNQIVSEQELVKYIKEVKNESLHI